VVAPNAEQREYWNGADSREWVDAAERYDEMLAPFVAPLLDAAAPARGERALDVGCGNGFTTLAVAELVGNGEVVGVDLSSAMLENARRRAASRAITNARFLEADAQADALPGPFDLLLSRFGIMFFDDPISACANLGRSLADDGRVAFVCWCSLPENEWVRVQANAASAHVAAAAIDADGPGPFRYGDPTPFVRALEHAGLRRVQVERFDTTILLGGRGDLDTAMAFLAGSGMTRRLLGDAAPEAQGRAVEAVREALAAFETPDGVRLGAAAWIVTASRR
jgi:SAM-dependent methyltransferase